MKEEAEVRQMQLHAQGCQGSPATPEARRGEEGLLLRDPRSNQPRRHPDRGLLPPEL